MFLAEPMRIFGPERFRITVSVDGQEIYSVVNKCECSAKQHVDDFRRMFPFRRVTFIDRTVQ
jgi:hypothetical protein